MVTPKPLFPGAAVALLSAGSPVPPELLDPAVRAVRALGFRPVLFPSCFFEHRHGYLAASDARRAADLNGAFADDEIDGILCMRGGYGAHRVLPLLDWGCIASHPKLFCGYSDVTALHTALNQICGLVTCHTIMPSSEYHREIDGYSADYLKKALFGGLSGPLENPSGQSLLPLRGGCVTAPVCGGNLSLLAASFGTPWEIDPSGKILFLEDVGEKTYRVDAMLTQLRNAGAFERCAGVLLGAWTDCVPEHAERTLSLDEIFKELIVPAGKPVLAGLACGHTLPSCSLPLGGRMKMDAGRGTLEVL